MNLNDILLELKTLLESEGYNVQSKFFRKLLHSASVDIPMLLSGNELWGGAGSVVDEAFVNYHGAKEKRLRYLELMMSLAEMIEESPIEKNIRQDSWVEFMARLKQEIERS